MFIILTSIFGFLTVPGLIQSASFRGNTLLYISAWGYVISFALTFISNKKSTDDKE